MYVQFASCRTSQVSRQIAAYSYTQLSMGWLTVYNCMTGAKTNDSFISMFLFKSAVRMG